MSDERGQATVEWIALLLLVALGLAALARLAPRADGRPLATSLVHSVTAGARTVHGPHRSRPAPPRRSPRPLSGARTQPVRVQRMRGLPELPAGVRRSRLGELPAGPRRSRLPELPAGLRRAGRGAGALWRRAWFACLVYERFRYAIAHPESRLPGYTIPTRVALRMANNCVSPVDLLRIFPDPVPDDGR